MHDHEHERAAARATAPAARRAPTSRRGRRARGRRRRAPRRPRRKTAGRSARRCGERRGSARTPGGAVAQRRRGNGAARACARRRAARRAPGSRRRAARADQDGRSAGQQRLCARLLGSCRRSMSDHHRDARRDQPDHDAVGVRRTRRRPGARRTAAHQRPRPSSSARTRHHSASDESGQEQRVHARELAVEERDRAERRRPTAATTPSIGPKSARPSSPIATTATARREGREQARGGRGPPPAWATSEVSRKCSGAPPRTSCTVSSSSPSGRRAIIRASASSRCIDAVRAGTGAGGPGSTTRCGAHAAAQKASCRAATIVIGAEGTFRGDSLAPSMPCPRRDPRSWRLGGPASCRSSTARVSGRSPRASSPADADTGPRARPDLADGWTARSTTSRAWRRRRRRARTSTGASRPRPRRSAGRGAGGRAGRRASRAALRAAASSPAPRYPGGARFAVALTHDIDTPWRWTRPRRARRRRARSRARSFDGASAMRARERAGLAPGAAAPAARHRPQLELRARRRARAAARLARRPRTCWPPTATPTTGPRPRPTRRAAATSCASSLELGDEVGLHGSYTSGDDRPLLRRRASTTSRRCSARPCAGSASTTCACAGTRGRARRSTSSASRYDTTLGFAERPGPRAGFSFPFRPWDRLDREQPARLPRAAAAC